MADPYKKPYLESSVFVSWIHGETVHRKVTETETVIIDGRPVERKEERLVPVPRAQIVADILTRAEQGEFPVFTSTFTIAEVHKPKGCSALDARDDDTLLAFFENDYIQTIDIDRRIGEDANRMCRQFSLDPADATHLASAIRAGCDVLLTWDDRLLRASSESIRVEEPRILGQLPLFIMPDAEPECQDASGKECAAAASGIAASVDEDLQQTALDPPVNTPTSDLPDVDRPNAA